MIAFSRCASRFDSANTCSCSSNSTPLNTAPKISSGSADRYRLMPHARITISSLFFVSSPIVTSVATSAAIGMM